MQNFSYKNNLIINRFKIKKHCTNLISLLSKIQIFSTILSLKSKTFVGLIYLLCALSTGCNNYTHYKYLPMQISSTNCNNIKYNKNVAIIPMANLTYLKNIKINQQFEDSIIKHINKKYPNIFLLTKKDPNYPNFLPHNSIDYYYNTIDKFSFAILARNYGLSAIIFQGITKIDVHKQTSGFFIFKSTKNFLFIEISTDIIDTMTGALLCRSIQSKKIMLEKWTPKIKTNTLKNYQIEELINDTLIKIAPKITNYIVKNISQQLWIGTTTSSKNKNVTIVPCSKTKIKTEDKFAIFCINRIIKNFNKDVYIIPSYKICEIKIIETNATVAHGMITKKYNKLPNLNYIVTSIKKII